MTGMRNSFDGLMGVVRTGKSRAECAKQFGVSYSTIKKAAEQLGLVFKRADTAFQSVIAERTEKMVQMHQQGCTLGRIGDHFVLTRERVRQILARQGITSADGGKSVAAAQKVIAKQSKRDFCWIQKYGLTLNEVKPYQESGVTRGFIQHRKNAAARGVEFGLTFLQWLSIWQTSGKMHLRGKGKGRYCMSRITDTGGYVIGNVHIQLATENSREAVKQWRGKTKANRGVFNLYPGTPRPWLARSGMKSLGFFATEAEAVNARKDWLAQNPPINRRNGMAGNRLGAGRGYYLQGGKFKVVICRKYIGLFKTEAEAVACKAAYLGTIKRQVVEHRDPNKLTNRDGEHELLLAAKNLAKV